MKLVFNVDVWLPCISRCVAVVNPKKSLPILDNLLIKTNDMQHDVVITSSDSETWLSIRTDVVEADNGICICVNATDFHKALLNLKGKVIEMEIDESKHIITCKHANCYFQLPYESADEFPKATELTDDVTAKMLVGAHILVALKKTGFATANNELRPIMSGIHFDFFDDGMVAVASDGYKLVKFKDKKVTFERVDGDATPTKGFTLPKNPANVIMNLLSGYDGQIRLKFNDRAVTVNNTDFKLTTRLIEGCYPNYDAVIPKDNNIVVTASRTDFIVALKRVLPMSNNQSELVSVKLTSKTLTLSAVDFDFSKAASEHIECDYEGNEITIGFKGSIIMSMLQNIDDDNVKVMLKDPSRAVLFTTDADSETTEYVSVLMPMLIQND